MSPIMLSKSLGSIFAIIIALIPTKCEPNTMPACTPSIEPAITVTISDTQTGDPLEATVLVKDGNFQEELRVQGVTPRGQTIYGGAFERSGIYTVITSKNGYETSIIEELNVDKDECHVLTRHINIILRPIKSH